MEMVSVAATEGGGGGGEILQAHVVELVASTPDSNSALEDQAAPLLTQSQIPKINIFSASFHRRRANKDQVARLIETEISPSTQFLSWAWSGSRYSGLLCVALSSCIYCIMEILSDVFSAQSIPLFEIAFIRCSIISILSVLWLRKSGQPLFGPSTARNLIVLRALVGCASLLAFIYCIQRSSASQAIVLSFTAPIMASVTARIILRESLKIAEISGVAFSFFGVLFIFRSMLSTQGTVTNDGDARISNVRGIYHIYVVLIGLFSSTTAGVSDCLVRAGAKASDQPVSTLCLFGLVSCAATAVCSVVFEDFVRPSFYSSILIVLLGILAFSAEIFLARGLQLEKTSKVMNIQYLEVVLSQLWGMGSSKVVPSFGGLVGCFIILASACCTLYIGPEKEIE